MTPGPGRFRRAVQSGAALVFFAAPWATWGKWRLIGFDVEGSLRLLGAQVPAAGLFPYLLITLALLFLSLWSAAALGRIWCGWLCPQSVLSDLSGNFRGAARLPILAGFSLASGVSALLYFVPPALFFSPETLNPAKTAPWAAISLSLILFADALLVGRRFCRFLCPYGKILGLLADREAVGVRFISERAGECVECSGCVRACPMGLDVRRGESPECIACARCVEACAKVFAGKEGGGLIEFRSPPAGWLRGLLLRPRYLVLLGAFTVSLALGLAALERATGATLTVRVSPGVPSRALDRGRRAHFLLAHLTAKPGVYSLAGELTPGGAADLRGEVAGLEVREGARREARFALILPGRARARLLVRLLDAQGREAAQTTLEVTGEEGAR